eukprot:gnl/MRDRNA2_/MRDRNA2_128390_c0_seq1.p1 gnl/MRDRNA2_/MRDRNA2_128390_c0~~gnl/MRDRNA2_/MRDRNA2_128390_c0_seq1.p1  ORF type:complete len:438 (-),score=80.15 gnl/MRDRNA2_/MRDRNA2_128390_c0_seq1:18-1331(-)
MQMSTDLTRTPPPPPLPPPQALPSKAMPDTLLPPPPPFEVKPSHPAASMFQSIPPPPPASSDTSLRTPAKMETASTKAPLAVRVERALQSNTRSSANDLVNLYTNSGLGGQVALSATTTSNHMLGLLLATAKQRTTDMFIDSLQQASGSLQVSFPHVLLDLRRRNVTNMPNDVRADVEKKIRSFQRWTNVEKSHVLVARHEDTIRYILAYALSQAKASRRTDAIWIPLSMDTGAQGHANGLYMEYRSSSSAARVMIYDPNYEDGGYQWVHAKKAVNDALPGVQRLLNGTGITVAGSAELFGHALQTKLGTVSTHKTSRAVVTTQRGYPICGAVVHLLAMVWLGSVGQDGKLEQITDVEAELANIVAKPEGKDLTQRRIAAMLEALTLRLSEKGQDPFRTSMKRRLDKDCREWPQEVVRHGGSITVGAASQRSFTYEW